MADFDMTDLQRALGLISRGTDEITKLEELEERFQLDRPLRVKVGFDSRQVLINNVIVRSI